MGQEGKGQIVEEYSVLVQVGGLSSKFNWKEGAGHVGEINM